MTDNILTYDIGTTGNKCTIFSIEGKTLASVTVPYETDYPKPGWSQQNPEQYWNSVVQGTRELVAAAPDLTGNISCIGLSGHMNGMLPVDAEGNPVFPEIIHSDNRGDSFCSVIRERIDDWSFYEITGNRIDSHLSLPKILWFKENRQDEYNRTKWILQSKDYVAGKLTGNWGTTDYSDASLTCVLDLKRKEWSPRILEDMELDRSKFPRPVHSHDRVGTLHSSAAELLGLSCGIPVFAGAGDAACSARGAGIADYTTAQNYIGSSSWISVLAPEPLADKGRRIQNFYDLDGQSINVCGTVQCAGIAIDWMMKELAGYEDGSFDYRKMEELAALSPPGSSGIFFLPYLMGERTPHWSSELKGSFLGLTLSHNKNDLYRAVMEGVALALRDVIQVFHENSIVLKDLSLTGGGALSPFWNSMMSSIYGYPVKIPDSPKQATSLGAAIAAGVGAGLFDSYESAARMVNYSRIIEIDPGEKRIYNRIHEVFHGVYENYESLSHRLASYQREVFGE